MTDPNILDRASPTLTANDTIQQDPLLSDKSPLSRSKIRMPESLLRNFTLLGQDIVFQKYEDLIAYKIRYSPRWKRPFIQLKDDLDRSRERYYEQVLYLPAGHLRGLYYLKPFGVRAMRIAKLVATKYHHDMLEYNIVSGILASFNLAIQDLKAEIQISHNDLEQTISFEVSKMMSTLSR